MRKKQEDRYRIFSWLSDVGGIMETITDMRGIGHPSQPKLNKSVNKNHDSGSWGSGWFVRTIKEKITCHPGGWMEYPYYGEPIFIGDPLVGFVKGDDPLFLKLKEVIGPHHFTPAEIMAWQSKNNGVTPPHASDICVVSFALSLAEQTIADNENNLAWTAERWAHTRVIGERFILTIERELVNYFMERGILAVAPDTTPMAVRKRYPRTGWGSPWSQRHIGYAAGLGTFGYHDFLITEKGCTHCMGSLVVNLKREPERRRPDDIHAHCLHYRGFNCLECAARCPVQAITAGGGHDKDLCSQRVVKSMIHCNNRYHIFGYGCGLCSTGVPCSRRFPG